MEKILAPADRILSEIGRLALARPLLSSILLISAITITVCSNEVWSSSSSATVLRDEPELSAAFSIPMPAPVLPATPKPAVAAQVVAAAQPLAVPSQPLPMVAASAQPVVAMATPSLPPSVSPDASSTVLAKAKPAEWQIAKVRSGDTLSSLLKKNGLSAKEAAALAHLTGAKALHNLKLGQEIRFFKDADGRLQQLAYAVSSKSTLNVIRSGSNYKATTQATPIAAVAQVSSAAIPKTPTQLAANKSPTTVADASGDGVKSTKATAKAAATTPGLTYTSGRITRSLTADARKAGLSAKQVNQLVQIFSQKNLAQNVRPGDEFSVLYENAKTTTNTKKSTKSAASTSSANILAAQLVTGDKTYRLIRFVDPKGRANYYTPEGQSLRDGLSRQPLNFSHISSYFSNNRLDPVLHYHRPHEGVDFAAPVGTPVQAAGDGVLVQMGYRGGYGRMVTIQHDSKYATRYAHLSKFANVQTGQTVTRGQIIGYVGQTGFATGPHLHFEIRVNDVAANPLTVALPGASIPAAYRGQFLAKSKVLLAQLNTNRQVWLAQAKPAATRQKSRG